MRSPAKRAAWRPRIRAARSGIATASRYPTSGNQGEEADQEPEHADVRRDPQARPASTKRSVNDGGGSKCPEEAAESAGDQLSRVADREPDRSAGRGADERADANAEDVRSEDPDERDTDPEPESQAEADRVPATHAEQSRAAVLCSSRLVGLEPGDDRETELGSSGAVDDPVIEADRDRAR